MATAHQNVRPIPVAYPTLQSNEVKCATDFIATEWVSSQGTYVKRFDGAFAEWAVIDQALTCNNGTAALHVGPRHHRHYPGRRGHRDLRPLRGEGQRRYLRGGDLVLMGDGPWAPPHKYGDAVELAVTFDDEGRQQVVAGAHCVINGSEDESLSNLLLDAWREGRPTPAAAGSEVMPDTSSLSGGRLMFGDYGEFTLAMDRYEGDHAFADRMGARGRQFMEREYPWQAVGARFRAALAHMAP